MTWALAKRLPMKKMTTTIVGGDDGRRHHVADRNETLRKRFVIFFSPVERFVSKSEQYTYTLYQGNFHARSFKLSVAVLLRRGAAGYLRRGSRRRHHPGPIRKYVGSADSAGAAGLCARGGGTR